MFERHHAAYDMQLNFLLGGAAGSGFFGLGAEQGRDKRFTIDADHPEVFAAKDIGATPVELVLSGLAGCLTAGVAQSQKLDGNWAIDMRRHGSNDTNAITYDWRDHAFGCDCVFLLQQTLVNAHLKGKAKENTAVRNIEIEEAVYRSSAERRNLGW